MPSFYALPLYWAVLYQTQVDSVFYYLRHLLYKASIQSGQHFCLIDMECSTLMHNEIIMESY